MCMNLEGELIRHRRATEFLLQQLSVAIQHGNTGALLGNADSIDGYSRRVIWLRCSSTNNDPAVVGSYYLDAVSTLMGCPCKLRTDRGSVKSQQQNLDAVC